MAIYDDTVKKNKQYLRDAQLDAIVKKSQQYSRENAGSRAEAVTTAVTNYDTAYRGLQNMGLAGRQGTELTGEVPRLKKKIEGTFDQTNARLYGAEKNAINAYGDALAAQTQAQQAAQRAQQVQQTVRTNNSAGASQPLIKGFKYATDASMNTLEGYLKSNVAQVALGNDGTAVNMPKIAATGGAVNSVASGVTAQKTAQEAQKAAQQAAQNAVKAKAAMAALGIKSPVRANAAEKQVINQTVRQEAQQKYQQTQQEKAEKALTEYSQVRSLLTGETKATDIAQGRKAVDTVTNLMGNTELDLETRYSIATDYLQNSKATSKAAEEAAERVIAEAYGLSYVSDDQLAKMKKEYETTAGVGKAPTSLSPNNAYTNAQKLVASEPLRTAYENARSANAQTKQIVESIKAAKVSPEMEAATEKAQTRFNALKETVARVGKSTDPRANAGAIQTVDQIGDMLDDKNIAQDTRVEMATYILQTIEESMSPETYAKAKRTIGEYYGLSDVTDEEYTNLYAAAKAANKKYEGDDGIAGIFDKDRQNATQAFSEAQSNRAEYEYYIDALVAEVKYKDKTAQMSKEQEGDELSQLINNPDSMKLSADFTLNPTQMQSDVQSKTQQYQTFSAMTDEQRGRYNYIYQTEGEEAAHKYFYDLSPLLTMQRAQQNEQEWGDLVASHPAAFVIANAMTVNASLGEIAPAVSRLAVGAYNQIAGAASPVHIDTNGSLYDITNMRSSIRSKSSEIILGDNPTPIRQMLNFAYQTGMSIADSASMRVFMPIGLGWMSDVIFFSSSANKGYKDTIERGGTQSQAVALGTLNGIAEALFEHVSLENWWHAYETGDFKGLTNFIRDVVVEGSEEVCTDIANTISDLLLMKGKASILQDREAYLRNGYSEAEADKQVVLDTLKQYGLSFLGGGISGGFFNLIGSFSTRKSNKARGEAIQKFGTTGRVIKDATMVGGQAATLAQEHSDNMTAHNTGEIYNAVQDQVAKTVKSDEDLATLSTLLEGQPISNEQAQGMIDSSKELVESAGYDTSSADALVESYNQRVQEAEDIANAYEEKSKQASAERASERAKTISEKSVASVYKSKDIKSQAPTLPTGASRVQIAEASRQNFKAQSTIKSGRVELQLSMLKTNANVSAEEQLNYARSEMTAEAQRKLSTISKLADALNMDVVVHDVMTGTNGYYSEDGKIHFALSGQMSVARVAAHELTHKMRADATEHYNAVHDHIVEDVGEEKFQRKLEKKAREYGYSLENEAQRDACEEEVIAELCEDMLSDTSSLERFAERHLEAAKALKDRLVKILNAIKQALGGAEKTNPELSQRTVDKWLDGLDAVLEKVQARQETLEGSVAGVTMRNQASMISEIREVEQTAQETTTVQEAKAEQEANQEARKVTTQELEIALEATRKHAEFWKSELERDTKEGLTSLAELHEEIYAEAIQREKDVETMLAKAKKGDALSSAEIATLDDAYSRISDYPFAKDWKSFRKQGQTQETSESGNTYTDFNAALKDEVEIAGKDLFGTASSILKSLEEKHTHSERVSLIAKGRQYAGLENRLVDLLFKLRDGKELSQFDLNALDSLPVEGNSKLAEVRNARVNLQAEQSVREAPLITEEQEVRQEGKKAFPTDPTLDPKNAIHPNTNYASMLQTHRRELNTMKPLVTIDSTAEYSKENRSELNQLLQEFKDSGLVVDRQGVKKVAFNEADVERIANNYHDALDYMNALIVLKSAKAVIKNGIEVGRSHASNYYGIEYDHITYAAPVTINGARADIMVNVADFSEYKGGQVYCSRIILDNGETYGLNAPPRTDGKKRKKTQYEKDIEWYEKQKAKNEQKRQEAEQAQKQQSGIKYRIEDISLTQKQKEAFDEYVQNALAGAGNNSKSYISIGEVSPRLVSDLKELGVDISGMTHIIRDNDIRHIRNRHGILSKNNGYNEYGVTTGDIQAIPYIVENYAEVRPKFVNGKLDSLIYALDYEDSTYYAESAVVAGENKLAGKQMIKCPYGEIPEQYKDVYKERSTYGYLDKAAEAVPEKYVQDVHQNNASKRTVPQSTQNVKTKFSLDSAIEETRDLIAVHNVSEKNLLKTLKLGGFPAISIAVTKAKKNMAAQFGRISVVFGKESIDPKTNADNRVFGDDSYTAEFPETYNRGTKMFDEGTRDAAYDFEDYEIIDQMADAALQAKKGMTRGDAVDSFVTRFAYNISAMQLYKYVTTGRTYADLDNDGSSGWKINLASSINLSKFRSWLKEVYEAYQSPWFVNTKSEGGLPLTVDNIVKAMRERPLAGNYELNPYATLAREYTSLDEIKADEARLGYDENRIWDYAEEREAVVERYLDAVRKISHGERYNELQGFIESTIRRSSVNMAAAELAEKVNKQFNRTVLTQADAKELLEIRDIVWKSDVPYFEAKPMRNMPLSEAKLVIVPEGTSQELLDALNDNNIPVETYEAGNEQARLDLLNGATAQKYMFSLDKEFDYSLAALQKKYKNGVKVVELSAKNASKVPSEGLPAAALKKAKKVSHPKNTGAKTYIRFEKAGVNVQVTEQSFRHGAGDRSVEYKTVCLNIASIAEEAVAVNEVFDQSRHDYPSTVYIALAKIDGEPYAIRLMVENKTGMLSGVNVLYAIRKEGQSDPPASNRSSTLTREDTFPASLREKRRPQRVPSGIININDFLGYVNDFSVGNSVLSNDVLKKLGSWRSNEPKITPYLRYALDKDFLRDTVNVIDTQALEGKLFSLSTVKNLKGLGVWLKEPSRIFDAIAGDDRELRNALHEIFEKPHSDATGRYASNIQKMQARVEQIALDAGALTVNKKGKKTYHEEVSAAIQNYGEGYHMKDCIVNARVASQDAVHVVAKADGSTLIDEELTLKELRRNFGYANGNYIWDKAFSDADSDALSIDTAPYTLEDLKRDFPDSWEKIVKADEQFREMYEEYINDMNAMLETIYPYAFSERDDTLEKLTKQAEKKENRIKETEEAINERLKRLGVIEAEMASKKKTDTKVYDTLRTRKGKINEAIADLKELKARYQEDLAVIAAKKNYLLDMSKSGESLNRMHKLQYRQDYYHHFQELGQETNLRKLLFGNRQSDISPAIVGKSEQSKAKGRWAGFFQQRQGDARTADAVNGMLKYGTLAEYKLAFDPLVAYVRKAEQAVREISDDTNRDDLIRFLNNWGNAMAGKRQSLDRTLGEGGVFKTSLSKVVDWMQGRVIANTLNFNMRSSIVQISNIANATSIVTDGKDWINGIRCWSKMAKGDAMMADIMNQSNFLKSRLTSVEMYSNSKMAKMENFANWMLSIMDTISVKATWWAAYNQYVRDPNVGMYRAYDSAIDYADDVARRTHGGRGVGEKADAFNSKFVNFIAPFQLEVNNTWNLMKDNIKHKNAKGIINMMATTFAMNVVFEQLVGSTLLPFDMIRALWDIVLGSIGIIDDDDDDDTKDDIKDMSKLAFQRFGAEVVSGVPFSNIATFLLGQDNIENWLGETDMTRYGSDTLAGGAVFSAASDIASLINWAWTGEQPKWETLISDLATILPPMGGKQLARTVIGATTALKGYSSTYVGGEEKVQFATDGDAGEAIHAMLFGKWALPEAAEYTGEDRFVQQFAKRVLGIKGLSASTGSFVDKNEFESARTIGLTGKEYFQLMSDLKEYSTQDGKRSWIYGMSLTAQQKAQLDALLVTAGDDKKVSNTIVYTRSQKEDGTWGDWQVKADYGSDDLFKLSQYGSTRYMQAAEAMKQGASLTNVLNLYDAVDGEEMTTMDDKRSWIRENITDTKQAALLDGYIVSKSSSNEVKVDGTIVSTRTQNEAGEWNDWEVKADYTNDTWYALSQRSSEAYEKALTVSKANGDAGKVLEYYEYLDSQTKVSAEEKRDWIYNCGGSAEERATMDAILTRNGDEVTTKGAIVYSKGKVVADYSSEIWYEISKTSYYDKAQKAYQSKGISPETSKKFFEEFSTLTAKDANGNTVSGLKAERTWKLLNRLNLTQAQKQFLYDLCFKK